MGSEQDNELGVPENPGGAVAGHPIPRKMTVVWSAFFLLIGSVLFMLLLWKATPVLLLLFGGSMVAIAIRVVSDLIARVTRLGRKISLILVLTTLFASGVFIILFAWPTVTIQVQALGSNLRESLGALGTAMRAHETGEQILKAIESWTENNSESAWATIAEVFRTTIWTLGGLALAIIVGIFLAYNPDLYVRGFLRLIPLSRRERASEIVEELGETLRWWLVGQFISMLFLFSTTWLMLWALNVPLALLLAAMTGALTFIPYLGPIIAAVPILLVAIGESQSTMATVFIFYLIIQNTEAYILIPIVMQRTVHLPPVLTLVSQILMGAVFGVVGIILATPLLAVGLRVVQLIYVEDLLGDSLKQPVRCDGI